MVMMATMTLAISREKTGSEFKSVSLRIIPIARRLCLIKPPPVRLGRAWHANARGGPFSKVRTPFW